jgi:hypothetical protein
MTKTEIIERLRHIIDERLFGNGPWLVDKESGDKIHTMLLEMGLIEPVPGVDQTSRPTPLGKVLHLDLLQVFMGAIDEYDACEILGEYGLMELEDAECLWRLLEGVGPRTAEKRTCEAGRQELKERVRRAYCAFFNPVCRAGS